MLDSRELMCQLQLELMFKEPYKNWPQLGENSYTWKDPRHTRIPRP